MMLNIPMPDRLRQLLAASHLLLFTGGACHIFARCLITKIPHENYRLGIICKEDGKAVHVMAYRDDYCVDALGVRPLEIALSFHGGHKKRLFTVRDSEEAELFRIVSFDPPKNEWGFHLHPEFIKQSEARTYDVIHEVRERYCLSLTLAGQALLAA